MMNRWSLGYSLSDLEKDVIHSFHSPGPQNDPHSFLRHTHFCIYIYICIYICMYIYICCYMYIACPRLNVGPGLWFYILLNAPISHVKWVTLCLSLWDPSFFSKLFWALWLRSLMTLNLIDEITKTKGNPKRECLGQGPGPDRDEKTLKNEWVLPSNTGI